VPTVSFACDAMLGGLARWLRLAGLDTSYDPDLDDADLARRATAEGRWLLTRDRALAAVSGPRVVLLRAGVLAEQLAEVVARLDLEVDEAGFFTRCSVCNGGLAEASPAAVGDRVPPWVATHVERFSVCTVCGKVYWPGTHHARILARLRAVLSRGATLPSEPRPSPSPRTPRR
jgi:uncharacterized protein